jgi:metal-responsive CopG/Arc/MetJ family transcriptional regulator
MKIKTSVTISEETLAAADKLAPKVGGRSRLFELALREYLLRRRRDARDARDSELLDEHADELNRETLDVLEFQAEP